MLHLRRGLSTSAAGPVRVALKTLAVPGLAEERQPQCGVVTMSAPPANAVNAEMITALHTALTTLEGDRRVRGLVLTSDVKGFFTAGIDLLTFKNGVDAWKPFWEGLRDFYLRVYTSRLISVAAINGHAPGAGTIFALACHYRFMVRNKTLLGLNEVAVGLPVPAWITERSVQAIGHTASERLLPLGATIPAEEAQRVGLVDKSFDSEDEMHAAAHAQLLEACSKIESAQRLTMNILRAAHAAKMRQDAAEDVGMSTRIVGSPEFQANLQLVLDRLAAKKKK